MLRSLCILKISPSFLQATRRERLDRAVVEVVFKPAEGVSGPADKEREEFLRSIATSVLLLAQHPRCLISVTVQVMHDDGGVLACAINAMCLALADSGLRMRAMVAATVCAVSAAPDAGSGVEDEENTIGGRLLLDPDLVEEKGAGAVVITAHEHKVRPPLCTARTLSPFCPTSATLST